MDKKRLIAVIGLLLVVMSLTRCTTQSNQATGWRVSFGISPVTSINDQASLGKKEAE